MTAQRNSTGVLNFEGQTFVQLFYACDKGRIGQIKLATPFVEPGFGFEYALMRHDNSIITSGTFTSEDVTDGELQLTFDKGAVRKDQAVRLKVVCPQGARIATLAKGASDADFGKLYVNGQSMQYNLAMAVGINVFHGHGRGERAERSRRD